MMSLYKLQPPHAISADETIPPGLTVTPGQAIWHGIDNLQDIPLFYSIPT